MPKAFSVASWNVEHFKNAPRRVGDVIGLLASLDPDVFALYEVEGKDVFAELVAQMPGYQFHITEGPQVQEILVGVRSGLTAFFTQKIEFKAGASAMRPGALLTVKALYELQRTGGRYALVTMCIGGGQGIAAVFERM